MLGQLNKIVGSLPAESVDERKAKELLTREIDESLSVLRAMCLYMGWEGVSDCLMNARVLLAEATCEPAAREDTHISVQ